MDEASDSEAHYQTQAAVLGWMLAPAAQEAAGLLLRDGRRQALSVLDVGAGSAVWSLALATSDPATHVTALDWPAVLEVAKESAASANVADRLECLPGNYHEVTLKSNSYDLVIVANVTHLESVENTRKLIARLYEATKPGGELSIIDAFAEGDQQDKVAYSLYCLGLALRTRSAAVHSRKQLESFLEEAGFHHLDFIPLASPPYMVGILLARK